MIIKGGSRCNRRFFAKHLLNGKDNERVRVVGFRGCANETIDAALRDMEIAAKGTRCKNFFYHADMNPREDEELTQEEWDKAVDTLERHLGLEGQPRFVVEHVKEGKDGKDRTHRHVVWQRVDGDTMTARSDSLTYPKHENAAREIEKDCGLEPVASVLVKDRGEPRPQRRAKDWEGFRAVQSGLDWKQVQDEVTELWRQTDNGASFKAALAEKGYILCRGDRRDFVIIDPAGDDHSLTRRIRGVNAAEVRERMKYIDRDYLPSVAEGRLRAGETGDSEAARAVRSKKADNVLKIFRNQIAAEENSERDELEARDIKKRSEHEPQWSTLEQAAKQYGATVKEVAAVLQDAYWQSTEGGKPLTDAEKLQKYWGLRVRGYDGPEYER